MSNFRFNPFTGTFAPLTKKAGSGDIVLSDAEIIRIFKKVMTTEVGPLGNSQYFWDDVACKFVKAPPQIVYDEDGCIQLNEDD